MNKPLLALAPLLLLTPFVQADELDKSRVAAGARRLAHVDVGSSVRWINAALVDVAKDALNPEAQMDALVIDATRAADALFGGLERPLRALRSDAR